MSSVPHDTSNEAGLQILRMLREGEALSTASSSSTGVAGSSPPPGDAGVGAVPMTGTVHGDNERKLGGAQPIGSQLAGPPPGLTMAQPAPAEAQPWESAPPPTGGPSPHAPAPLAGPFEQQRVLEDTSHTAYSQVGSEGREGRGPAQPFPGTVHAMQSPEAATVSSHLSDPYNSQLEAYAQMQQAQMHAHHQAQMQAQGMAGYWYDPSGAPSMWGAGYPQQGGDMYGMTSATPVGWYVAGYYPNGAVAYMPVFGGVPASYGDTAGTSSTYDYPQHAPAPSHVPVSNAHAFSSRSPPPASAVDAADPMAEEALDAALTASNASADATIPTGGGGGAASVVPGARGSPSSRRAAYRRAHDVAAAAALNPTDQPEPDPSLPVRLELSRRFVRPNGPLVVHMHGPAPMCGEDVMGLYRRGQRDHQRPIVTKQLTTPRWAKPGYHFTRYLRFYAPKGHGVFEFRLFDEARPEEDGEDVAVEPSEDGQVPALRLTGWSAPLRVEAQGSDLCEALSFTCDSLEDTWGEMSEEGPGRESLVRLSNQVAKLVSLLARARVVPASEEAQHVLDRTAASLLAAATAVWSLPAAGQDDLEQEDNPGEIPPAHLTFQWSWRERAKVTVQSLVAVGLRELAERPFAWSRLSLPVARAVHWSLSRFCPFSVTFAVMPRRETEFGEGHDDNAPLLRGIPALTANRALRLTRDFLAWTGGNDEERTPQQQGRLLGQGAAGAVDMLEGESSVKESPANPDECGLRALDWFLEAGKSIPSPDSLSDVVKTRVSQVTAVVQQELLENEEWAATRESVRARVAQILEDLPDRVVVLETEQLDQIAEEEAVAAAEEEDEIGDASGERRHTKSRPRAMSMGPQQPRVPGIDVNLFGSSRNGFGTPSSDVDMVVLPRQFSPADSAEWVYPSLVVEAAAQLLEEGGMAEVVCRSTARVPIVLFQDPESGLECDLCAGNALALRNTHLLHTYSRADSRVSPLALLIKHWAKARNLNNPSKHSLSSYGYVLMLLARLMRLGPNPVLPCLQSLPPAWDGSPAPAKKGPAAWQAECPFVPAKSPEGTPHDTYFYEPQTDVQWERLRQFGARNTASVGELLLDFFYYYGASFDPLRSVVSIRPWWSPLSLPSRCFQGTFPEPRARNRGEEDFRGRGRGGRGRGRGRGRGGGGGGSDRGGDDAPVLGFEEPERDLRDPYGGAWDGEEFLRKEWKAAEDGWSMKPTIAIEDPFETGYDVAHVLRPWTDQALRLEMMRAYLLLVHECRDTIPDAEFDVRKVFAALVHPAVRTVATERADDADT